MYIRARFHWWPASYQVFPSTNGPTAPAAGTRVGNRVNVPDARPRCETTFNAPFLRSTCSFSRPSSSERCTNSVLRLYTDSYIIENDPSFEETNGEHFDRKNRIYATLNEFAVIFLRRHSWRDFSTGCCNDCFPMDLHVSRKILKLIRRLNCGGNSW